MSEIIRYPSAPEPGRPARGTYAAEVLELSEAVMGLTAIVRALLEEVAQLRSETLGRK
jgi:hypothetical protein